MGSKSSGSTSSGSSPIPYRARSLKPDKSVYAASNKVRKFFIWLIPYSGNNTSRPNLYEFCFVELNGIAGRQSIRNYSRITVWLHRCFGWSLEIGCLFHVNVRRKKLDPTKRKCYITFFLKYMKTKMCVILFEVFIIANLYLENTKGPHAHQRTSEQGSNEVGKLACKFL